MRYPKEQKALTRQRIVREAGRLFREGGYAAVGVDAVMSAAGLTAGGFYAHFKNKEALFAEAISQCTIETKRIEGHASASPLEQFIRLYLSEEHVAHPERGCPWPTLATEVSRQSSRLRKQFTASLKSRLEGISALLPGDSQEERLANAFQLMSAMAGAILMARAIDDRKVALQMLDATRSVLLQRWVPAGPPPPP